MSAHLRQRSTEVYGIRDVLKAAYIYVGRRRASICGSESARGNRRDAADDAAARAVHGGREVVAVRLGGDADAARVIQPLEKALRVSVHPEGDVRAVISDVR